MNRRDRGKRPLMQLRQSSPPATLLNDYVTRRSLSLLDSEPAAAARTRLRLEEIAKHNHFIWLTAIRKSINRHDRKAAARNRPADRWHARDEGVLPPIDLDVLVRQCNDHDGGRWPHYAVASWTGERWFSDDRVFEQLPITHWRPLPPPPQPTASSRPQAGPGDRSPPPPVP